MLNAIETGGPGLTLSAAHSPARKPKLAVISTYDELCGIAAYTVYLKKQLDEHFDVTVFEGGLTNEVQQPCPALATGSFPRLA